MVKILQCKPIAEKIMESLREKIVSKNLSPKLVAIAIGHDPASDFYITNQKKKAEDIGISYELKRFSDDISLEKTEEEIQKINKDGDVTAVIIQTPLPKHLDINVLINKVDPKKDAEGLHPLNLGKIFTRTAKIVPCTPMAVMAIIKEEKIDLYGKDVVLIGHSQIVGKPLSVILLNENATVSICHIGTSEKGNLKDYTKKADILIVAVGKAGLINTEHIKEGAIVIDVGINYVEGKIKGDVDAVSIENKASLLTPVPGGVGTLTTSMLMKNVVKLEEMK
jgi:methylenetetrahydrofolate dehydrogenase (NADP+)/methenyltetrahydrofolate cyclohydrolase